MTAPGWQAFDQEVVTKLRRGDASVVKKHPQGGMRCPLAGHDHWLPWAAGGHAKGTEPHGDPPLTFRVSPTYILEDPLDNFIAGRELVAGLTEKAETFRLGYENSEDAVSWNVFRSLQEGSQLHLAASVLAGVEFDGEPELILWGRRIDHDATAPVPEIKLALDDLEPTHAQQTEPDVVLRLPGWGWIFIEAKLSSPTSTYAGRAGRLKTWIERYADPSQNLFDAAALTAARAETFPEQLLRNVAVADRVRASNERAVVVALVRQQHAHKVDGWAGDYLTPGGRVTTASATWEKLYAAVPAEDTTLRRYLRGKSVGLRPAFDL
jgi:restriction endonuclease-like protein